MMKSAVKIAEVPLGNTRWKRTKRKIRRDLGADN